MFRWTRLEMRPVGSQSRSLKQNSCRVWLHNITHERVLWCWTRFRIKGHHTLASYDSSTNGTCGLAEAYWTDIFSLNITLTIAKCKCKKCLLWNVTLISNTVIHTCSVGPSTTTMMQTSYLVLFLVIRRSVARRLPVFHPSSCACHPPAWPCQALMQCTQDDMWLVIRGLWVDLIHKVRRPSALWLAITGVPL